MSRFYKHTHVTLPLLILFVTTIFWSLLGAKLQVNNADQLISSYLFTDQTTFQNALLPNAHTFLLKWPFFLLVSLLDHSNTALTLLTVLVSVTTVGGLAYTLYRIERRPQRFGALILALSSVLLFIPAQPHLGGLLPVNFAMLTTRNIEYIVYIMTLIFIIRSRTTRERDLFWAILLLGLLVSSDRLFLLLSFGGSVIMLITYIVLRRPSYVQLALRWILVSICSGLVGFILLWLIERSGIVHIIGQTSVGPYGFTMNPQQIVASIIFAITGMLTNFGANPVFDIGIVRELPRIFWHRLSSLSTIGFATNAALFTVSAFAAVKIFIKSIKDSNKSSEGNQQGNFPSTALLLSLFLIFSSIVALVLFVVTDHYVVVDSRYLTITFFALFISLATYQSTLSITSDKLVRFITVLLMMSTVIGCLWTWQTYKEQASAFININQRNDQVAAVVKKHPTDLLIGDYWRVVAIKNKVKAPNAAILPLQSCLVPRDTLSSKAWELNLKTHSFSYLLTLDQGLTDYPSCSIDQTVGFYGQPNASSVIEGTNDNPTELVLFYDHGISKDRYHPKKPSNYSTILPVQLPEIVKNSNQCTDNVSVMNIVAHQDDDLLFMNPDLGRHIAAGHCVRTVYMTAGDAGQDSRYWLGRERASRVAYASLLGINEDSLWIQRRIKVNEHEFVTELHPKGNKKISLLFMRLADGNLTGKGFSSSKYESLDKLLKHNITTIHAVDDKSYYSSDELTSSLLDLMKTYQPTIINTQSPTDLGTTFHDHSDHITAGIYANRAHESYDKNEATPIYHYIGYPIREKPENVFGDDLTKKMDAFMGYSHFDGGVCQSIDICMQTPTYWTYLHRQYKN